MSPKKAISSREHWVYPVDINRLAKDLKRLEIDIASTRIEWVAVAREIANVYGENGREAFMTIASVWPMFDRHDSELCYNAALRKADQNNQSLGYISHACRLKGIDVTRHPYRCGTPYRIKIVRNSRINQKTMNVDKRFFDRTQPQGRSILGRNQLTDLLLRIFPQGKVLESIEMYLIGFDSFVSGKMGDSITFWQIDKGYNLINAKRINYKFDGHRDKSTPPCVLYNQNGQCLFGLHLYNEQCNKIIGLVESEKSALICSIYYPELCWMATGSMDNFNAVMLKPIKDRNIIAFPDVDINMDKKTRTSISFSRWKKMADNLNRSGWKIQVDDKLEKSVNTAQRLAKIDIADLILTEITDKIKQQ